MKKLALLGALAVAGCATQPQSLPVLSPQEAQQTSAAELCLGTSTWGPISAGNAMAEIQRRGVNCQDHAQAIQGLQQQRAAAAAAILGRPQPTYQPYQLPMPQQQTRCTTRWDGAAYRTVCQ